MRTPFSLLYPDEELFIVPLKTFGCTCFVQLLGPHHSKFEPKASKCIFLGYAQTQKGYCCYDPVSGKMFVSMDVTFFEETPYYPRVSPQGESSESGAVLSFFPQGESSESGSGAVPLPIPMGNEGCSGEGG